MLVKKICKKCFDENGVKWNAGDENRWKNGIVYCRSISNGTFEQTTKTSEIIKGCPYKLEHITLGQGEKL